MKLDFIVPALAAALLVGSAPACVPYPSTSDIVDQDIVLSQYDERADFGAARTFALPDQIAVVKENAAGQPEVTYTDAPEVVTAVRRNMVARGYTEVFQDGGVLPDVAIGMAAVANTVRISSGWVCAWYPWWWGPVPCFPAYPSYTSYTTRTFTMEMIDVKAAYANPLPDGGVNEAAIIWSNVMYGVVSSNFTVETSKVARGVDEAFAQSPYVKAGN